MLQRIPSIAKDDLHLYFDSINKILQLHYTLKDVPALLELVMWKLMIVTNFNENDIFDILSADEKTKCQEKTILMVRKNVPPVLCYPSLLLMIIPICGNQAGSVLSAII
jgi:hypothetical protein